MMKQGTECRDPKPKHPTCKQPETYNTDVFVPPFTLSLFHSSSISYLLSSQVGASFGFPRPHFMPHQQPPDVLLQDPEKEGAETATNLTVFASVSLLRSFLRSTFLNLPVFCAVDHNKSICLPSPIFPHFLHRQPPSLPLTAVIIVLLFLHLDTTSCARTISPFPLQADFFPCSAPPQNLIFKAPASRPVSSSP